MEMPDNVVPMPTEQRATLKRLAEAATPGPWHAGCFVNDESTCNCKWVTNGGYAGSICTVDVDNGLPISEGGNDSPPPAEAKANLAYIAAVSPDVVLATLAYVEALEAESRRLSTLAQQHAELEAVRLAENRQLCQAHDELSALRVYKTEQEWLRQMRLGYPTSKANEAADQLEAALVEARTQTEKLAQQHQEAVARAEAEKIALVQELLIEWRDSTAPADVAPPAAHQAWDGWQREHEQKKLNHRAFFDMKCQQLVARRLEPGGIYAGVPAQNPAVALSLVGEAADFSTCIHGCGTPALHDGHCACYIQGNFDAQIDTATLSETNAAEPWRAVFATEAEYDASVADVCRRIESGEITPRQVELNSLHRCPLCDESPCGMCPEHARIRQNEAGAAPLTGETPGTVRAKGLLQYLEDDALLAYASESEPGSAEHYDAIMEICGRGMTTPVPPLDGSPSTIRLGGAAPLVGEAALGLPEMLVFQNNQVAPPCWPCPLCAAEKPEKCEGTYCVYLTASKYAQKQVGGAPQERREGVQGA